MTFFWRLGGIRKELHKTFWVVKVEINGYETMIFFHAEYFLFLAKLIRKGTY